MYSPTICFIIILLFVNLSEKLYLFSFHMVDYYSFSNFLLPISVGRCLHFSYKCEWIQYFRYIKLHIHTHTHTYTHTHIYIYIYIASQVVLVVTNLPDNAGDIRDSGLIPGSVRCPGGGHGNPIQYSCLENPMDRRVCQATVNRVA